MLLASENASPCCLFHLAAHSRVFLHWPTEVSQGSGSSPKSLSKGSPKEFALEDTMTAEICGTEQAPGKTCQSQTTDPKHCFDSFCSWCIEDQVIRQWGIWGYLCCFHSSWRESLTSNKLHDAKSKGVLLLDLLVWRKRSTSFVSIFWTMMALEKALVRYLSYMLVWYCWGNISYTTYHQLIGKLYPIISVVLYIPGWCSQPFSISSKPPRHQWWLCQIWSAVWRSTSFYQGLHNRWTHLDT